jgi:exodeoxyribonuclease VII small subunit
VAKEAKQGEEPAFECLLAEAEALADKMEEGGLSLGDSIKAYEKGVDNLRRCAAFLRDAEEKAKLLVEKNGMFRLEDLDADVDPEAGGDAEDGE